MLATATAQHLTLANHLVSNTHQLPLLRVAGWVGWDRVHT